MAQPIVSACYIQLAHYICWELDYTANKRFQAKLVDCKQAQIKKTIIAFLTYNKCYNV